MCENDDATFLLICTKESLGLDYVQYHSRIVTPISIDRRRWLFWIRDESK